MLKNHIYFTKRKIVSLLVSISLIISLMPVNAFANDEQNAASENAAADVEQQLTVASSDTATNSTNDVSAKPSEPANASTQNTSGQQADSAAGDTASGTSNVTDSKSNNEAASTEYTIMFESYNDDVLASAVTGSMQPVKVSVSSGEPSKISIPQNAYESQGMVFNGWQVEDPQKEQKELSGESCLDTLVVKDAQEIVNLSYTETVSSSNGTSEEKMRDLTKYATDNVIVFKATWKAASTVEDSATYKIVFDGNGADEGRMDEQMLTCGKSECLITNAFSRTGYTFSGWSESDDGEAVYNNEETVKDLAEANASKTLYASWTANKYTLKFDANGGEGEVPEQIELSYDATYQIPSASLSKDGKDICGWKLSTDDGEYIFKAGEEIKNLSSDDASTVVLYAVYDSVVENADDNQPIAMPVAGSESRDGYLFGAAAGIILLPLISLVLFGIARRNRKISSDLLS